MNEEQKKWDVVPFDTFEQYLGPRYENVPGVEYILENGTLLYFMEEAPGVYESADHTVTGATDKPSCMYRLRWRRIAALLFCGGRCP